MPIPTSLKENPPYNEKVLMQQVSEGDELAFGILFDSYRPRLYSYILKLSKSQEMAEDVVQDVFLKIWKGREKLIEVEHFSGFLFQVARNHAYNGFRRRAKETLILAALRREETGLTSENSEERILHKEVQEFIRQAVDKLTPQQKQVFLMSREQGMKHEEIAQELHITTRTVSNHISEALRFLRNEIRTTYGPYAVVLFVLYQL